MKTVDPVEVPNVQYLSDWTDLDNKLPQGKIIVNKIICGCGMTDYYLTNDMPVILASPRRELILSKTKDPRTRHAYYFDRSDNKVDVEESKYRLSKYLDQCVSSAPKIMCTYKSLYHVIDVLFHRNCLDIFTIIGDEMTCIFTDAKMNGPENMELVNLISTLPNRCIFITATPLKEPYLDAVPVFKDMTYVTLKWPKEKYNKVLLRKQKMETTQSAICGIIESFRTKKCFDQKFVDGKQYNSTEAVFFINSVKDIISVVKKAGLTSADTRVICADDPKNRADLKKVGLEIGHFPGILEYKDQKNKRTFTFATKCSFEGADLHSDCAKIYVFADSNRENLSLDISIDLPQIIGRCRTKGNPFRHDIELYYKTTNAVGFELEEAKQEIQAKIDRTHDLINKMSGFTDLDILEKFKAAQAKQQYSKDYVDVVGDGNGKYILAENALVILADLRAMEIAYEQYKSNYSVFCYLKDNGYDAVDYHALSNTKFGRFLQAFDSASSFEEKMKIYINGCSDSEVEKVASSSLDIPEKFQRYYSRLGKERIKALAYKEINLYRELAFMDLKPIIRQNLEKRYPLGNIVSLTDLKLAIQGVYDYLKLKKKAKATDILEYFPDSVPVKTKDNTGKRHKGYKIL